MLYFNDEKLLYLAKEYNYGMFLINILQCTDDGVFKQVYPIVYNTIYNNQHCRDGRTPLAYAQNLIKNWIYEDTLVKGLQKVGINIHLNGAEAERNFLQVGTITQAPDTRIESIELSDGRIISCDMELIKARGKRWERNNEIDTFRDNKVDNLINDKALCFCCEDTGEDGKLKFAIIDFSKDDLVRYPQRESTDFHGKLYTPIPLSLNFIEFEEFDFDDMEDVKENILEILSEREGVDFYPKDSSIPLF